MPTVMKIGRDDQVTSYSDLDLFSWPNNPRILDIDLNSQRQIIKQPHQRIHTIVDSPGLEGRTFVLTGFFVGTNKITDMNTLFRHVHDPGLLRFYYTTNRFFFCFGAGGKHTFPEGRTNFLDYVVRLLTPLPFAYDDTLEQKTFTIADALANNIATGLTNDGSAPAHILQYRITNNGTVNITKVEIGDKAASGGNVQGNKITWDGTLAAGSVLDIFLFKLVEDINGLSILKKLFFEVDGSESGSRQFDGKEAPFIAQATTDQTFSVKLTGNNGATTTIRLDFRDAYWV